MFPIILGVSKPVHTPEELAAYEKNSRELIEIDGKRKTRYEWTQEQRRIETAIRQQKDVANLAKACGDDTLRREAQANINALQDRYAQISKAAGLAEQPQRMTVAGFGSVKVDQLKATAKSGILSSSTKVGGGGVQFLCKINPDQLQNEFGSLNTLDVVLTDERALHIKERHPEDFALFEQYGEQTIISPDLILRDTKNENTIFMVKKTETTNLNTIVRLSVVGDDPVTHKNSVMTFYRIRDKNLIKLSRKHKIVYKKQ